MGLEIYNKQQAATIKEIFADGIITDDERKKAEKDSISNELMTELQGKTPDQVNEYVDKLFGKQEESNDPWYKKIIGGLLGGLTGAYAAFKMFKGGKAALIGGLIGGVAGFLIGAFSKRKNDVPVTNEKVQCKANEVPAFTYTVKSGDSLAKIGRKNNVSLSRLRKMNPMKDENKLYIGQEINIPKSYNIDGLTIDNNLKSVSEYSGVSENYLHDIIDGLECKNNGPELKAYYDGVKDETHPKGHLTIGFGHIGKVNGKPINENTEIKLEDAYRILTYDILAARAEAITFLGEEEFFSAPQSLQDAIIDIAYNKSSEKVFDGIERDENGNIINDKFISDTTQLREDLANRDYVSAAKHVIYNTENLGLKKRNIYRVITATRDLTAQERSAVLQSMKQYYESVHDELKDSYPTEARILQKSWEKAEKGNCSNFFN